MENEKPAIGKHAITKMLNFRKTKGFPAFLIALGEARYVTVGWSAVGRLLVVGHTDRGDSIRIITARQATHHERKYHENKR